MIQDSIPENRRKVELAEMLRTSKMTKFLTLWNAVGILGRMTWSLNMERMEMDLDKVSGEVVIDLVG